MSTRRRTTTTDLVFGALANPTRRDILDLLLTGPQPVQAIADHFDMTRPSISEHLKVLRDCNLVTETRSGRHRYYRIDPNPLHDLQSWLTPYEQFWRRNLERLGGVLDTLDNETDATP